MNFKSATCFSRTGEPLTEYNFEQNAREGADYANIEYGNNLIPYRCHTCGLWHLSPKNRQTPSIECGICRKALYKTKKDAEKRAVILKKEEGERLRVYRCPYNDGWHLTKLTR
ncbi:MAG: hypothetical protein JRJ44_02895 [Deltaproteobacteria bacterium]|nr:hypothetical protein [Deltaproteobacteria bacterium]